jgi:adenylate kinase
MYSNIVFIGGIHGVGKSTVCRQICNKLNINYLSASEVLKWKEINYDFKDKKVENISLTQDILVKGLRNTIQRNQYYLLDGHYCLLNKDNKITNIPFETFKAINPISLNIIIGEIDEIKKQLEERDQRVYDYNILEKMQTNEINYASKLSEQLGITLNIGKLNNFSFVVNGIEKILLEKGYQKIINFSIKNHSDL